MTQVYVNNYHVLTPIGNTIEEVFQNLNKGKTGIALVEEDELSTIPIQASLLNKDALNKAFEAIGAGDDYTLFEKASILSIKAVLESSSIDFTKGKNLFILSTTKGNIDLISKNTTFDKKRVELGETAKVIMDFFKLDLNVLVVSNACISGVAAQIIAQRYIKSGKYDAVLINGTDLLSRFVVSGFQSFLSLSALPCKPFDKNRDGLTLGEASASMILSKYKSEIEMVGGSMNNDANHISGPSRTGEGLLLAINQTLKNQEPISLISAHGTATRYNDDMESVAISRARYEGVSVNSLKGYFGHTLGAAGLIETIISLESLKRSIALCSKGSTDMGTVEPINVVTRTEKKDMNSLLKLASGFGGCNAAAYFRKV